MLRGPDHFVRAGSMRIVAALALALALAVPAAADMREKTMPMVVVRYPARRLRPPRPPSRGGRPSRVADEQLVHEGVPHAGCVTPSLLSSARDAWQCTACERILKNVAPTIALYNQQERQWTKELGSEIMDKMSKESCSNEEMFAKNSQMLLEGCIFFMKDFYDVVRGGIRRRLSPKYEEYGEDIDPRSFCEEIGACSRRKDSLDRTFGIAQEREKHRERMLELIKDL